MSTQSSLVRERPILFSSPMVRAILEGHKTQTRRVVKPQPSEVSPGNGAMPGLIRLRASDPTLSTFANACPYGVPGDRLWVRETWALAGAVLIDPCLKYKADGSQRPINHHKTHADMWYPGGSNQWVDGETLLKVPDRLGWQNVMFMPRWASRITLEITDVRVQRVQEISEEDAQAEGIELIQHSEGPNYFSHQHGNGWHNAPTAVECFADLWESINGKTHPWASNDWVWALTFRRVA